ncbi:MAG: DUF86 domain-containing protein [Burkholderiales bacterium]
MDREVIEEKLESLRRCIHRVREKHPMELDALVRNFDLQDIISLNLTRAVQLCVDIGSHMIAATEVAAPDSMSESFDAMAHIGILDANLAGRLKKAVGFRNIAVHNYRTIDWAIVHAICQHRLGDFEDFAKAVMLHMEKK